LGQQIFKSGQGKLEYGSGPATIQVTEFKVFFKRKPIIKIRNKKETEIALVMDEKIFFFKKPKDILKENSFKKKRSSYFSFLK